MGHQFPAWDALNAMVREWVLSMADQRTHGTIFRKPAEAFVEKRLRPHHGAGHVILIPAAHRFTRPGPTRGRPRLGGLLRCDHGDAA
jgi:hypothetical protein